MSSRFSGWTDVIDKNPLLMNCEMVHGDHLNENNRSKFLPPEQKSEAPIKTFLSTYTEPGDIVLPFSGSFST